MHKELKEKAIKLRLKDQLSYNAILAQVPVAKSTLSEWLSHFPLSPERILELKRAGWKKNEAKIELFRATMRAKREKKDEAQYFKYLKKFQTISKKTIFISGLMLYLAEGAKTNKYTIAVSNTDSKIIKFHIRWLNKFFAIPLERQKAYLHLYENMDIEKEVNFWKNVLGFKDEQFYKPYITKFKKNSFLYRESFRHGTCTVSVCNTEVKRKIMMAIRAYLDATIHNFYRMGV